MINATPLFAKALNLSIFVAFFGIIFSIIIGFFCAVILFFKARFIRIFAKAYVEIAVNTPPLIQLFFLYYALPVLLDIKLNEYICAIAGLSFLGGGYMCYSFILGLDSINKAQLESAKSLGLSNFQILRFILLPQALSVSMPSISANIIFLFKETSVIGVIALADIMFVAKDLITTTYKTNEALLMLILAYLLVLLPLSLLFSYMEKRFTKALN